MEGGLVTAAAQRSEPTAPDADAWTAANTEFDAGRVLGFSFTNDDGGTVPVKVTLGWLHAWRRLPLTLTQRSTVRTACTQISRDKIHPCLGKRRVDMEPIGAWMASPCPGVTVTWRPHWNDSTVPVMLTLTLSPSER